MMLKIIFKSILYLGFLFGLVIPFHIGLANVILGIFISVVVLYYVVNGKRTNNYEVLNYSTLVLLAPIFISLIHYENGYEIFQNLGRRITFLLCPLALILITDSKVKMIRKNSLFGLYYGVLLSSITLLFHILLKYYSTHDNIIPNKDLLNYHHTHYNFTRIFDIHPSYYGMFVITALLFLLFGDIKIKRWQKLSSFILFFTVIIFLNSRIILFVFTLISLYFMFKRLLIITKSLSKTIIISNLIILLFFLSSFYFFNKTYAYQKIVHEVKWELSYKVNSKYNSYGVGDSRLARWFAAFQTIKKKPFLGYGVGKEVDALVKQYEKMGMKKASSERYNSHNQFLGYLIEGGAISGILLCFYLGINIFKSYNSKLVINFFFFTSIFLICLIENYLIRNAGIIFVAFFGSFFIISYPIKKKNQKYNKSVNVRFKN